MIIDKLLKPEELSTAVKKVFSLAETKIHDLNTNWDILRGAPVVTVKGKYTTRGWTEWTQGFQYGSALLTFDATGDNNLLKIARSGIQKVMPNHITHTGVHDHGFNTMSTYGNLLRLAREDRWSASDGDVEHAQLAIRVSGAVQAARWNPLPNGLGYIYSFNGPQSLFIDTIRSLRVLACAHEMGQVLMSENDNRISLLKRLLQHLETTLCYLIYTGTQRDYYDQPGRVAHEAIFNVNNGSYRCASTQQGYSPFSTWTRGLAWAILGLSELLEYVSDLSPENLEELSVPGMTNYKQTLERIRTAAIATADFYLANAAADGIPYWDTGAPGLTSLGDWRSLPSNPFNSYEPVDSSAAAIAAQGLLRLGMVLKNGFQYNNAGLTIAKALFSEPYLSVNTEHQGILLHTIYHRPNGWDYVPEGRTTPCGESCQWGDYHVLELALLIQRLTTANSLYWLST